MRLIDWIALRLALVALALYCVATGLVRFVRRVMLAARFYVRLGYSWHLAWIKAEREGWL